MKKEEHQQQPTTEEVKISEETSTSSDRFSSEIFPILSDQQVNKIFPLGEPIRQFMAGLAEVIKIVPEHVDQTRADLKEQDFKEAKAYFVEVLNHIAQKEFAEKYHFDNQSKEATAKAFYYLSGQVGPCEEMGLDLRKGFILVGNPGSGKSLLGRAMKYASDNYHDRRLFRQFTHVTCKRISLDYKDHGLGKIEQFAHYKGPSTLPIYFEDIGKEDKVGHYETPKELMADILELRYDLFLKYGLITLGDTNMGLSDFGNRYGTHIEGRVRQMCNVVGLGNNEDYFDRRKLL